MADLLRFGSFELDIRADPLHNKGRIVRLAPQPFKLLTLLTATPGRLVTREENVETVPKRGYRFIAPVDDGRPPVIHAQAGTDGTTAKLLWTNVAELRMQEEQRKARQRVIMIASAVVAAVAAVGALIYWIAR